MTDSSPRASGQCHCGAIRYSMPTAVEHHALCNCQDCRRHSGAPLVGWALVGQDELDVSGTPKIYESSENGRRHFCGDCGTGLFYTNEAIFPGKIDVQSATLDDPDLIPPGAQIQTAERIGWMERLNDLPAFERYPPFE
ncbi:GFA family protein [Sphingopyxis witflariensis]|uniref:Aldehyde-activating protein n=1 Tax=Sphingopyxis witflariensis TaxID=173675 RepID=A0A246JGU0_9SPHN|nr:GFA family protein [Sphingopyxis witflariensis]OWQ91748.1 aldehyde-activating protein [Sphingopyxis witflariensis]